MHHTHTHLCPVIARTVYITSRESDFTIYTFRWIITHYDCGAARYEQLAIYNGNDLPVNI